MHYLGIDIGGTRIKTILTDENGKVLNKNEYDTKDGQGERWKQNIIRIINDSAAQYPEGVKFGISAPGLVDSENRMTLHMPERLLGIENYNWSEQLGQEIWALNDGHAACLAEYISYYQDQGIQHMVMMTLGTGVGGGIIIEGNLFQGAHQRAGHLGHMTVDYQGPATMTNMPGSLEHAIGNFSIQDRSGGAFESTWELVHAFRAGDRSASVVWLESVKKLAVALASLVNVLSPEIIVLGGGISAGAGTDLLDPLKKYMNDCEWRPGGAQVRIELARHESFAGAVGAAGFAKTMDQKSN